MLLPLHFSGLQIMCPIAQHSPKQLLLGPCCSLWEGEERQPGSRLLFFCLAGEATRQPQGTSSFSLGSATARTHHWSGNTPCISLFLGQQEVQATTLFLPSLRPTASSQLPSRHWYLLFSLPSSPIAIIHPLWDVPVHRFPAGNPLLNCSSSTCYNFKGRDQRNLHSSDVIS